MPEEIRFSAEFDRFACRGCAAAIQQQETIRGYLDAGGAQWAVDLGAATMSGDGRTIDAVTRLGSFSELTDTWLWTWDDPQFGWESPVAAPLRAVYEVGEQLDIVEFTTGGFSLADFADPAQAAVTLAVAAGRVLGGRGIRAAGGPDDDKGTVFLHLGDESVPYARFDPLDAPRLLLRAVAQFPADPRSVVLGFAEHHRLKLDLDPDRIVLYGDGGSVLIEFGESGRIASCESDVSELMDGSDPAPPEG
jgi:hypothetical protein